MLARTARESWPASCRVHGIEQGLVCAHSYGPRLTTPAEAIAFRSMGADVLNHSLAPEATLSREIGACFVLLAFVTAGFSDYMDRGRGTLIQADVLPNLSMLASRIALETAAALASGPCNCHALLSPQPDQRYTRF